MLRQSLTLEELGFQEELQRVYEETVDTTTLFDEINDLCIEYGWKLNRDRVISPDKKVFAIDFKNNNLTIVRCT